MLGMRIRTGGVNGACSAVHQYLNRKSGDESALCAVSRPKILSDIISEESDRMYDVVHGRWTDSLAPCTGDEWFCHSDCFELRGRPLDQQEQSASDHPHAEARIGHGTPVQECGLDARMDATGRTNMADKHGLCPSASIESPFFMEDSPSLGHRRVFFRERAKMAGSVYSCSEPCHTGGAGGSSDARCVAATGHGSVVSSGCCELVVFGRLLHVGGYSNTNSGNALNYGLSYVNANNSLSNSNANIGGRLTYVGPLQNFKVEPTSHGAKQNVVKVRSSSTVLRNEDMILKGETMPKSIKNLRKDIVALSNIREAAKICCSKRKDKAEVARFAKDSEQYIKNIQRMLVEGTYEVSDYRYIKRYEHGKLREIGDLPLYPDRIIHQAFAQVIEPLLDRKLIPQSHASRAGHGIHSALEQARWCISIHPKIRYCLSVDAHHCYKSIQPSKLKSILARYIGDRWTYRWLCYFIDVYPEPGICIGDRLSPLFCNLYFNEIDHHMYEVMRCHGYVAYADNRFIFGNSKAWLLKMKAELDEQFAEYGLEINPNWHIADLTKEGVDFLGFRLFKTHTLLRKSTKKSFIRAMVRLRKKLESGLSLDKHDIGTLNSYKGLLRWCNSKNLYNIYCRPVVELHEADLAKKKALKSKSKSLASRKKVNS